MTAPYVAHTLKPLLLLKPRHREKGCNAASFESMFLTKMDEKRARDVAEHKDTMLTDRAIRFARLMFNVTAAVAASKADSEKQALEINAGNVLALMTLPAVLSSLKSLVDVYRAVMASDTSPSPDDTEKKNALGRLVEDLCLALDSFLPVFHVFYSIDITTDLWIEKITDQQFSDLFADINMWLALIDRYGRSDHDACKSLEKAIVDADADRERILKGGYREEIEESLREAEDRSVYLSILASGFRGIRCLEEQFALPAADVVKQYLREAGFVSDGEVINGPDLDVPLVLV